MQSNERQKPVHELRLGKMRAAIWGHSNESGEVWYSVTLSRLYRDGAQWKDSTSFSRDDLPIVAKVADMAYAWIWNQSQPAYSNGNELD